MVHIDVAKLKLISCHGKPGKSGTERATVLSADQLQLQPP